MTKPNYGAIFYFISRYKMRYIGLFAVALPVSILEGFGIAAFFPLFSNLLGNSPDEASGFSGFALGLTNVVPV